MALFLKTLFKGIKLSSQIYVFIFIWLYFLIYGGFSLSLVPSFKQSIGHYVNYFYGIVLVLICLLYLRNYSNIKSLMKNIQLNVILVILFSVEETLFGQYLFSYHPIWSTRLNSLGFHHPLVQFYNPNDLAVFVTMFSLLLTVFYIKYEKNNKFLIYFIYLGSILITFVTDAKICQIILIIFIVILGGNQKLNKKKYSLGKIMTTYIFIFSIFMLLLIFISKNNFIIFFLSQFSDGILKSNSMQTRFYLWKKGFELFIKSPFLGLGVGATETLVSNDLLIKQIYKVGNIHNFFIEFLADFGFINFLLLIYIFYKIFISKSIFKYICKIGIVIFLICSIVLTTFLNMLYIWLFLGVILVLSINFKKIEHS